MYLWVVYTLISLYFNCFELIEWYNQSHLFEFIVFLRTGNAKTEPRAIEFTQKIVNAILSV